MYAWQYYFQQRRVEMKSQYRMLFFFITILTIVSLACGGSAAPTSAPPTNPPPPPPTAVPPQNQPPQQTGGSGVFTDQNGLLAFDLPSDWTHEYTDHGSDIYSDTTAYTDTFTSPDQTAKIESLVMFANAGVTVNNSTSQAVALDILNTYYSSTGTNNGDIRISSDQIMQDGSERFQWKSKGGGYSGVSFFEVRGENKRTWLMWTAWWLDGDTPQEVLDTIDAAINSYHVPK